jgi:hypothetical protein
MNIEARCGPLERLKGTEHASLNRTWITNQFTGELHAQ